MPHSHSKIREETEMSSGLHDIMWRAHVDWAELIKLAEGVIARWNTVTGFVMQTDMRERIWTVRHASVAQPFLVFNSDSLRGSVPRAGNPMSFLLLLGIAISKPGALDLTFANGQKIDPTRFELADLHNLLPQATHPAHRQLAALAMQGGGPAPAGQ
jgi:hypothetical protein